MKKWTLLAALLLLCQTLSAQFTLTESNGFFDRGTGHSYVVQEFPGKSQRELFDACRANLRTMRHTENLFFDGTEYETITVSQYVPDVIWCARMLGVDSFMDIDLTVTLRFKDGKVRADSPVVKALVKCSFVEENGEKQEKQFFYWISYRDYLRSTVGGDYIYNRRGSVKPAKMKIKRSLEDFVNTYVRRLMGQIHAQTHPDEW